jgi:hypothetical protein
MADMHAGYIHDQGIVPPQGFMDPTGFPPGMDPIAAWGQYQYPYPYDPSLGYAMDPAMYQQYWNANNSWYGPQYDYNGNPLAESGGGNMAQQGP